MAIITGMATLNGTAAMSVAGCLDDFCYTMNGGIVMGGCAVVTTAKCVTFRFAEGSTVFICDQAASHGKLVAIRIKKVVLINNRTTYGAYVPIYIDTLNGRWTEDELCSQSEAIDFAESYLQAQLSEAQTLINSLCD